MVEVERKVERVGMVTGRLLGRSDPSVEVSLSKAPNPNCFRRAGRRHEWLTTPSVYDSVYGRV